MAPQGRYLPGVRDRIKHWTSRARHELRTAALRGAHDRKTIREDVAARYLRGHGLEIGALNLPLRLPRGADVTYVDPQPHDELVREYGVLYPGATIVAPGIVDDGE